MAVVVRHDVTDLLEADREIRTLNADLEERVKRRTAQLEVSTREIEAFTDTVAHDLGTPRRAIDGSPARVVAEHSPDLSEERGRLLGVVRDGVRKMAVLIDDLLAFSGIGRVEPRLARVDMAEMSPGVAEQVLASSEQRDLV